MSIENNINPAVLRSRYESRSRIWRMGAIRIKGQIRTYTECDIDPDGEQVKMLTKWAEDAERLADHYQRKADAING